MVFEIIQLSNGDFALREKNTKEPMIQLRLAGNFGNGDPSLKRQLVKQMFYAAIKTLGQTAGESNIKHDFNSRDCDNEDRVERQAVTGSDDNFTKHVEGYFFDQQDMDLFDDLSSSRTLH